MQFERQTKELENPYIALAFECKYSIWYYNTRNCQNRSVFIKTQIQMDNYVCLYYINNVWIESICTMCQISKIQVMRKNGKAV